MGKSNKFSLATKSHSTTRVNPYDKINLNALNVTCPDKQIVLPKLDANGIQQAYIELYSLFIFVVALATQYLNLYRSVWWLSKSHNSQPINYHLIDLDASQFALIFIGQSSLIGVLRALLNKTTVKDVINLVAQYHSFAMSCSFKSQSFSSRSSSSPSSSSTTTTITKSPGATTTPNPSSTTSTTTTKTQNEPLHSSNQNHNSNTNNKQSAMSQQSHLANNTNRFDQDTFITIVTGAVSWICNYYLIKCAYRIWNNFGLNGVLCISYPILVSIIINSTHIIQVTEDCRRTGKLNLSLFSLSMTLFSSHIQFDDSKLCHQCSNQPDEIREEVDRFRTIFNQRLKFILFKSILLAYYSSFVPICFAQGFLYYDHTWTAQHVALTWLSSLIMLKSSSYTPHFYDALHRSAYHFGKWQKLEARNTLVPCINWSENVIYPQGVVVKHYRGYFRSESVSNCAQPGVSSHLRYYIVFSNPKIGYASALALLGPLLTAQMYVLLESTEWYKLIAMTSMMFINVHSIFRLVKSLVVITKIYKEKH